jgi:hypothetical protein
VAGHLVWPGVVRPPLGPNSQKTNFERFTQGGPNHLLGHWGWFGRSGGNRTSPSGPGGGLAAPWAKRSNFHLAHGVAEPPCGPLGVVRPPPNGRPGCGRTTPSGPEGGSVAPWAKRSNFYLAQVTAEPPCGPPGVVRPPPNGWPSQTGWPATTYRVVRPSQHIYIFWIF